MFITGEFLKRSAAAAALLCTVTLGEANDKENAVRDNSLELGARTSQPIGHFDFCRARPSECNNTYAVGAPVNLTYEMFNYIAAVDARVNGSIVPELDIDHWGKEELWSYAPDGRGDCEDYALEKRRALMQIIHPYNLLITVVRKPDGEGHAILTVRTDRGDIFLDNLQAPMYASESGYKIIKVVDPRNDGKWVSVLGRGDMAAPLSIATLTP